MLVLGARDRHGTERFWTCRSASPCGTCSTTGPLFVVEFATAALLLLLDPALALIGLPILLLQCLRLTAQLGLRKAERDAPRPGASVLPEEHVPR